MYIGITNFVRYRSAVPRRVSVPMIWLSVFSLAGVVLEMLFQGSGTELLFEVLSVFGFILVVEDDRTPIDSFTGLGSYIAFRNAEHLLLTRKREHHVITLRLKNLDFYRQILSMRDYNDAVADVAHKLKNIVKKDGSVYRLGENLFAVQLYGDAIPCAKAIADQVDRGNRIADYEFHFRADILIMDLPRDAETIEDEINMIGAPAPYSMDNVNVYTASKVARAADEPKIVEKIREALQEDRVEVWYQPIWSNESESIVAAEALARIRRQDGSLMPPGLFIPTAERNGMIIEIGDRVFEKVCEFIENHSLKDLGLKYISVNLSVNQLLYPDLVPSFMQHMEDHKVRPEEINIEITESADVSPEIMDRVMKIFHVLGIRLSLDDYGTGYSNLMRLMSEDFVNIKIDKSVLDKTAESETARRFYADLIGAVRTFGKHIIQEGVVSEEQLDYVLSSGVDMIQGFYFSKPLSEDEFIEYAVNFPGK